ncbi:hypothetical protein MYX76_17215 [Desulfobacterota bacterium AH_259_B03_O07]|nr:hypothetical protein [Desulfobacterota bacterium AH_259_B03_O07]
MSQTISGVGGIKGNLAPDAFHRWATHYYKCKKDFRCPHSFSLVPYFLLCRAIELELKSRYLHGKNQAEVKDLLVHDILKAYDSLEAADKILTTQERDVLKKASKIYLSTDFTYFNPQDALTGFSRFPDLEDLDNVAKKIIGPDA